MSSARSIRIADVKDWTRAYEKSNPSDMLKIKKLLDEDIDTCNLLFIGARLEPGEVHRAHYHRHVTVIVYGLRGKAVATVDGKRIDVLPDTLVYMPPKAVHEFVNSSKEVWECVAMAVGPKGVKLENVWINRP